MNDIRMAQLEKIEEEVRELTDKVKIISYQEATDFTTATQEYFNSNKKNAEKLLALRILKLKSFLLQSEGIIQEVKTIYNNKVKIPLS